jgi:hypothetical protein
MPTSPTPRNLDPKFQNAKPVDDGKPVDDPTPDSDLTEHRSDTRQADVREDDDTEYIVAKDLDGKEQRMPVADYADWEAAQAKEKEKR